MNTKRQDPAAFWRGYEAETGERVRAFSMGRYLSGWPGEARPLWGLLIATDGGFRFHYFPQEHWLEAMARTAQGGDAPREREFVVPRCRIRAVTFTGEKSVWARFFSGRPPRFSVRYVDEAGVEAEFVAEADDKASRVAAALT